MMPRHDASELATRLGREAEAVCRHYLSSGHRAGRYWLVGDVQNTPGRSMFVRLTGPGSGKGAAGKWTDMATGEHGDLLDVIREALGLVDFKDVAEEARRFLALPHPEPEKTRTPTGSTSSSVPGSCEASRRLFAMAQPIRGTLAEIYLSGRAITRLSGTAALRFHPRCYYRPDGRSRTEIRPALVAAVTDLAGHQTGAHRTWLATDGSGKAAVETPRRAMGDLLGHGVRFGTADEVLAVGEGIETVLSPRSIRACPACRCWRRFRPLTSLPSCSRRRCAGSMSSGIATRPGTVQETAWLPEQRASGSRRCRSRRARAISMMICDALVPMPSGRP